MSATFVKLDSVAEFINGVAFKPEDWGDSGAKIIRIQNLTDPNKPFNRTERTVSEKYCVRPGDLLVSWSATLGVFEWLGPDEALLNQHIFRVLPNEMKVEKRYLFYALDGALLDMQRHLHGATMKHVNRGEFVSTKLFLPSLPEQTRISDILDRAEFLRAKRRAVLVELDELIHAIFLEMFGDPVANPKGWEICSVGSFLVDVTNGLTRRRKESDEGTDIVLRLRDIRAGWIDFSDINRISLSHQESNRYQVSTGDLLFIRVNGNPEYVGRCALFESFSESVYFNDHIMRVKTDQSKVNGKFLVYVLNGIRGKREISLHRKTSAGQHTINQDGLSKIEIPLPHLKLQQEFALRVAAVEYLKTAHKASLAELDKLFASLQYRAFRGEL